MSTIRCTRGVLLSLLLFAGACGRSTASSALSKDAGPSGGAGAGGALATGGAGTGGALATGGAGTGGALATGGTGARDAATTPAVDAGSSVATGGAGTGDTRGTGGANAGGASGTGGAGAGGARTGGATATGGARATGGANAGGAGGSGGVDGGGVVCVAGTKSCFGNTVETCSAEGDRRTIEYCAAGLLCNQFTLTCTARTICTPNQPLCNGAVATTCNADGTAYAADSTDCAAVGQVCYQGACLACWPTAYFCSGAEVRHCAADGKSSTLTTTCASGQYCDTAAGIGACKPQICTPNQAVCDGNTATTCKADGSGFATGGTKCTDAGKLCYQGACASLACSPGAYFCSGSTRRHCADDGMISTESASCTGSVYCDSASGTCKGIVCTPGQAVCDGTVVKTCNADGSGYTTSDCVGMGQLCGGGQCVPPTMGGSSTFCAGSRVIRCTSTGDCWSSATCTSLEYCDSTTATCQPLLCVPNHPTCNADNTPVVCYTDGKGYANDGTSCGSRLCVSGTCRDVLFADDFEDADLTGWQATAGTVWSISTSYAAAGTLYSLRGGNGGMYRTFAGLVPSRVGWWLMAPSATFESGRFVLTSTAGQEHPIATSYFTKDGTLALVRDTESVAIPYAANLWYHIELRNIDWTAKTFDYYVNDTLVRAAAAFQDKEATSIGRLDLSNPGVVTAYWDEIELD